MAKELVIPGLLIEHLVVGSAALTWLIPLAEAYDVGVFGSWKLERALLLIPAVYVLGMLVDHIAFWCVTTPRYKGKSLKDWAREHIRQRPDVLLYTDRLPLEQQGRANRTCIHLARKAPELLKEAEMRSSRDRIARSTVVNLIALSVVCVMVPAKPALWLAAGILACAFVALSTWKKHEGSTYAFELRALVETGYTRDPEPPVDEPSLRVAHDASSSEIHPYRAQ